MQIKCDYCGSLFDETLEKCPNCGASNVDVNRSVYDQPKTIENLKNWYSARRLPPYETTRFFIGIDYKGPRAFGIYKDENSGKFIVYKNKDDGSRAVRYEGTDEAYAVNELYMRLKSEILEQKERNIHLNQQSASEDEKEEAYAYFTQKPASKEDKDKAFDYIKNSAEHKAAMDEAYQKFLEESEYKRKRKENDTDTDCCNRSNEHRLMQNICRRRAGSAGYGRHDRRGSKRTYRKSSERRRSSHDYILLTRLDQILRALLS